MPSPAAHDLLERSGLALERGGHLLTAGELAVVRRIRSLDAAALSLFANLAGRVDRPHPEAGLDPDGLLGLWQAGLVDALVPADAIARGHTVGALRSACASRGLPTRGGKEALVARLQGLRGWWAGRWIRLRHRALLQRLGQWADLHPWPDPRRVVLERLGIVRWPAYTPTPGGGLFPDRAALLRWEAAWRAVAPEDAAAAWARGDGRGPAGLDLTAVLAERVRGGAEAAERAGELDRALALWGAWRGRRAEVAFREARVREARGDAPGALDVLRAGLADATPAEAVALVRAGRRIARARGTSFPPTAPLPAPPSRELRLRPGPSVSGCARPRWEAGEPVEAAVVGWLAALGRAAVHSEGSAWRTVASVLLADVAFLPIPGALPVPRLPGPLDFGTPAFAERRAGPLAALLAELRGGGAVDRWEAVWPRWRGVRLRGVDPGWDDPVLGALVRAVPGAAWADLVDWRARGRSFGGMPDLIVLPGPEVVLPGALPGRLGPGLAAVELKGPGDVLRDHQADWLQSLLGAGIRAELWEVRPAPPPGARAGPIAAEWRRPPPPE